MASSTMPSPLQSPPPAYSGEGLAASSSTALNAIGLSPMATYDVVVVGLGPAGATAALFLARYGIRVLGISRHDGPSTAPRAHIFNQRAMEVLREAGLEEAAMAAATPAEQIQHTAWMASVAGEEYARVWAWGNKPGEQHRYAAASPCRMADLPQNLLEPLLVDAARDAGAEIKYGSIMAAFELHRASVAITIRGKDGSKYVVEAKYMVGADGGRSAIVDALGINVDGRKMDSLLNVHVRADLGRYMAHRPASLSWILQPSGEDDEWETVGGLRMVRPWSEWMVGLRAVKDAKDGRPYEPSLEQIKKRVQALIGDDSVPVEVKSVTGWTLNNQVARTWQKGRILCIGDAVHRHPPTNGLGSNTCISDGFNVAWKVAYVLKGLAGRQLLDTLTAERKPVGDAVVRRAVDGLRPHAALWALWGTTAAEQERFFTQLESTTAEGRGARERLAAALDALDVEHQAVGLQMNQIYTASPAIYAQPDDVPPTVDGRDLLKEVVVSTYPGYHLPHAWLVADALAPRVSTLDVCGRGGFTLLTGNGGGCWAQAAKEVRADFDLGLAISVHSIGFRCDYADAYRDWARVREVQEDGVVLVRPDHFVGWRYHTHADNATSLLRTALAKILANANFVSQY